MEDATHYLAGILIYEIFYFLFPNLNTMIGGFIILILVCLSHFLVDALTNITYHLPDPKPSDKFWVTRKIVTHLMLWTMLIIFWNPYWFVMIGSIIPDIVDWFILRRILKKGDKIFFHPLIDKFKDRFFFWLPDLREKRWALLNEFIIMGLLGVGIFLIKIN